MYVCVYVCVCLCVCVCVDVNIPATVAIASSFPLRDGWLPRSAEMAPEISVAGPFTRAPFTNRITVIVHWVCMGNAMKTVQRVESSRQTTTTGDPGQSRKAMGMEMGMVTG